MIFQKNQTRLILVVLASLLFFNNLAFAAEVAGEIKIGEFTVLYNLPFPDKEVRAFFDPHTKTIALQPSLARPLRGKYEVTFSPVEGIYNLIINAPAAGAPIKFDDEMAEKFKRRVAIEILMNKFNELWKKEGLALVANLGKKDPRAVLGELTWEERADLKEKLEEATIALEKAWESYRETIKRITTYYNQLNSLARPDFYLDYHLRDLNYLKNVIVFGYKKAIEEAENHYDFNKKPREIGVNMLNIETAEQAWALINTFPEKAQRWFEISVAILSERNEAREAVAAVYQREFLDSGLKKEMEEKLGLEAKKWPTKDAVASEKGNLIIFRNLRAGENISLGDLLASDFSVQTKSISTQELVRGLIRDVEAAKMRQGLAERILDAVKVMNKIIEEQNRELDKIRRGR